jgi:hypothetical protein
MYSYPKQQLSYKDKIKNNNAWGKEMVRYISNQENFANSGSNTKSLDYYRKLANYRLYNNVIDQADFVREFNPAGISMAQADDEIQAYNESYNKINILLSEEWRKRWNYKAICVSPTGIKEKEQYKSYLLKEWCVRQIQKEMQTLQGMYQESNPPQEGQKPEEYQSQMDQQLDGITDPAEIDKMVNTKFLSAIEKKANTLLKYYEKALKLKWKKNEGFKHGLIAGDEHVWVGIENNMPVVDTLNSLGIFYHKSPETMFIQDGLYAGFRTRMHVGDIMDKFGRDLEPKDMKRLIDQSYPGLGFNPDAINKSMKYDFNKEYIKYFGAHAINRMEGSHGESEYTDYDVYHVEWRSERKIGFLTFTNPETGEEDIEIVDESYKVNKATGESIEWEWIPEVWEGIKISDDIFVNIRPKLVQFRSYDNPYKVKLGYHGLVYNNMNAATTSLMDRMKPYQYLYLVVMHKLKQLIATDEGMIMPLDISMIDKKIDLEKTLYYMSKLKIFPYNPLENAESPGAAQRSPIQGAINRSNAQHIMNYINLADAIEKKIGDVSGVLAQRQGQVQNREAVANVTQSIIQSNFITEPLFIVHNMLWEEVMSSLLRVTQFINESDSMVMQYVLDDMSRSVMSLAEGDIAYEDFGIFVSDAGRDHDIYEQIQQMSQVLLQNGGKLSDMIKIYQSLSLEDLKTEIEALERQRDQAAGANEQRANELQQQVMEKQAALEQALLEKEYYKINSDNETKIRVAEINSYIGQAQLDLDANGIPDPTEISEAARKELETHAKINQADRKLQLDDTISKRKADVDKYKADIALKIAKENKNKFDSRSKK